MAGLLAAALLAVPARADPPPLSFGAVPLASPWQPGENSRLRLVAGDTTGEVWTAALQIELAPGWKTYWRNPGDSGVPPRFDFSASANLRAGEALFPAPHRFTDSYGDSIGYKESVSFPLFLSPAEPGQAVELALKVDYALCNAVCVPASADLALMLAPGRPDLLGTARAARAAVPAADDSGRLTARVVDGALTLLFEAPAGAGEVDVFAEPPAGWYLTLPEPAGRDGGGRYRFTLPLKGKKPGAELSGERFTLTGVSDKGAFERRVTLD